jgi:hypothetical protein
VTVFLGNNYDTSRSSKLLGKTYLPNIKPRTHIVHSN